MGYFNAVIGCPPFWLPGERDVYTFDLSQRARFYFDALSNNSSLRWPLEGPTSLLIDGLGSTILLPG